MIQTRRGIIALALVAFTFTGNGAARQAPPPQAPSPATVVAAANPISWGPSLEAAKRAARPGQVIVVDVSTDWCSWCRYMERHVYNESTVREFAAQNVFVRFDPKDGGEGQAFAKKQKVKAYPSIFVFAPDGKLIRKQVGAFTGSADFLGWLSTARR